MINNQEYVFDENSLVLVQNNKVKLSKLFSEYVKHTKLTKYHFSESYGIFFFLYRYFEGNLKGVHFWIIIPLQKLFLMIKENKYLISEGTNIMIPQTLNEIF